MKESNEKIIRIAIRDLIQTSRNLCNYIETTNQRIDEVWKGLVELKRQINKESALMSFGTSYMMTEWPKTATYQRPKENPITEEEVKEFKEFINKLDNFKSI